MTSRNVMNAQTLQDVHSIGTSACVPKTWRNRWNRRDTNRNCVNDKKYFEDEIFGHFLKCQSITRPICRDISSSNKVHIICQCLGIDNFWQFWSFCVLAYRTIIDRPVPKRTYSKLSACPHVVNSDVKSSSPKWPRGQNWGQNFGLGLGIEILASAWPRCRCLIM